MLVTVVTLIFNLYLLDFIDFVLMRYCKIHSFLGAYIDLKRNSRNISYFMGL